MKTKSYFTRLLITSDVLFRIIGFVIIVTIIFSCKKENTGTNKWTTYTIDNGLVEKNVKAIAIDKQGNIWFGTDGGISKFDGTNWVTYTINDGLVSNGINTIIIDNQDNKWFGTNDGVSKYDDTNWVTYTAENGLVNNGINTGIIDKQGNKWFGTDDGISKFDGTNWITYISENYGLPYMVTAIAIDKQENIWFGTLSGVTEFNGTKWTTYPFAYIDDTKIHLYVLAIAIDAQGNKWFGTDKGVLKFDGTNWITYTSENSGLPNNLVTAIAIDKHGYKWFGTVGFAGLGGGISEFDGKNWINGLADLGINAITIDEQGNKWFGTYNGIWEFEGTKLTTQTNSQAGSQVWELTFQSDNMTQTVKVTVAPFTHSGTFSETSDSPGLWMYDPGGNKCYNLPVEGTIDHDSPGDRWRFADKMSGNGCGMTTTTSNSSGTANGNFPDATYIGNGVVTLTTTSPLGTVSGIVTWTGQRQ